MVVIRITEHSDGQLKHPHPIKSSFDTVMLDWDRNHIASQARIQAHQAARLGELQKVNKARIAEEARQQHQLNTQVKEAATITKHTQVIGRIQELLKSSNGRAVMRNMKREKDKLRVLNEQVALEQAKQGKAAAQIQAVAKISGIVEKYADYNTGVKMAITKSAGNSERES